MSVKSAKIINFLLIQGNWFICVLGAANGMEWMGPTAVFLSVCLHLRLFGNASKELLFMVCALAIGWNIDSLLLILGALSLNHDYYVLAWGLSPFMLALWVNFAMSFSGCMNWIHDRYLLGAMMGFIGGPVAYFSGSRLGAVIMGPSLWVSLLWIGIFWAVAMIFMMRAYAIISLSQRREVLA